MIRLDGVSKSFRSVRVLERVSLEVERGERVALVGANGAGKTTLIRCLLGEYSCQGEVSVGGLAPRVSRQEVLGRVGFVPQLPPPLRMPVGQLVRFASQLCGCEAEGIQAMGRRLGLDVSRVWRQPFAKLSGGQKQKLLIALALRDATDLLVLDEPAANLDPEARRTFFRLLEERGEAATMIVSIHRLDEVAGLVNRVVELDRGRVVRDERLAVDEGRGDGPAD
jgi:ABC-2 type transport system ATP-binding protein